jgi:hypothetical protein
MHYKLGQKYYQICEIYITWKGFDVSVVVINSYGQEIAYSKNDDAKYNY